MREVQYTLLYGLVLANIRQTGCSVQPVGSGSGLESRLSGPGHPDFQQQVTSVSGFYIRLAGYFNIRTVGCEIYFAVEQPRQKKWAARSDGETLTLYNHAREPALVREDIFRI